MRVIGTVLSAIVVLGVMYGLGTYLGDGVKPFQEGWYDNVDANIHGLLDWTNDTAEEKVPQDGSFMPDVSLPSGEPAPPSRVEVPQGGHVEVPVAPQPHGEGQ